VSAGWRCREASPYEQWIFVARGSRVEHVKILLPAADGTVPGISLSRVGFLRAPLDVVEVADDGGSLRVRARSAPDPAPKRPALRVKNNVVVWGLSNQSDTQLLPIEDLGAARLRADVRDPGSEVTTTLHLVPFAARALATSIALAAAALLVAASFWDRSTIAGVHLGLQTVGALTAIVGIATLVGWRPLALVGIRRGFAPAMAALGLVSFVPLHESTTDQASSATSSSGMTSSSTSTSSSSSSSGTGGGRRECLDGCEKPPECHSGPGSCDAGVCWYPHADAGTPCARGSCDGNGACWCYRIEDDPNECLASPSAVFNAHKQRLRLQRPSDLVWSAKVENGRNVKLAKVKQGGSASSGVAEER
jgi:hypothetical protein